MLTTARTTKIRAALRLRHDRVRIARDGSIHVYGTMPNTNQIGWSLWGYVDDLETERMLSSTSDGR